MISLARIFEAWRDARIFTFPTEPWGRLWHFFKYPQYGLLLGAPLTYFLILNFGFDLFGWWVWNLLGTLAVAAIDGLLAWGVFEYFLGFFRDRIDPLKRKKGLNTRWE